MTHSAFDPVYRDLDNYLTRIDEDEESGVSDLLLAIEYAESLLGRAERAIKAGDIQAGRDLMHEASGLLVD